MLRTLLHALLRALLHALLRALLHALLRALLHALLRALLHGAHEVHELAVERWKVDAEGLFELLDPFQPILLR